MKVGTKQSTTVLLLIVGTTLSLSYFRGVPYIYTLIGFSAWALLGHLVTIDDDVKGGWSNPDGSEPFPWLELLTKVAIFMGLCAIAALCASVRNFGAPP
ncbi:MAG: hypothetical protein ACLGPL_07230 [Acidobacteriota bacterium]